MRVVHTNSLIKTQYGYYRPYVRYIVSDFEWENWVMKKGPGTDLHWSSFNSFERRYGGQDLSGKKLLVYRHNAFGDQLMISALPRYIKSLYPDSIIHVYCVPSMLPLWLGNSYVGYTAIPIPIPFDLHDMYDYHLMFEGMLENNSERDQSCSYDDMFAYAGLSSVSDRWKRPYVAELPEDYVQFNKYREDGRIADNFVIYHAAPANMNRAYPPKKGAEVCRILAEEMGQVIVLGLDKEDSYRYQFTGDGVLNLINEVPSFRSIIPFIKESRCVICPDSAIMHLAACFEEVPVVSLWGVFHPNDRAKYYNNNTPLDAFDWCAKAPCRDHNFYLPEDNCKKSIDWDKHYCSALSHIPIKIIVNTVLSKLKKEDA